MRDAAHCAISTESKLNVVIRTPIVSSKVFALNTRFSRPARATIRDMRMCDDHRIKGWWFLPETPDERVPGILTWSQEKGATLELIGGFSKEP